MGMEIGVESMAQTRTVLLLPKLYNDSLGKQSYLQMKTILPSSLQYLDLFHCLAHYIDMLF